jgi:hypothetical protein
MQVSSRALLKTASPSTADTQHMEDPVPLTVLFDSSLPLFCLQGEGASRGGNSRKSLEEDVSMGRGREAVLGPWFAGGMGGRWAPLRLLLCGSPFWKGGPGWISW